MGLTNDALTAIETTINNDLLITTVERLSLLELRENSPVPYAAMTVSELTLDSDNIGGFLDTVKIDIVILFVSEQDVWTFFDNARQFKTSIERHGLDITRFFAQRFENVFDKRKFNYGVTLTLEVTESP